MQIFYPFSLQVMPNTFPGASPDDCPRDASKARWACTEYAFAEIERIAQIPCVFVDLFSMLLYMFRMPCLCSAVKMGCTNAQHPDKYGHYREAIVTAIKHHWWWKVRTTERCKGFSSC